ncbi:hypothetical protein B0O99DRAFT_744889 [Bisporella sp. PMI_857]|nr:hypothetical protein B0O99DRAFT_744889 [Bisporella sp. PMI_857]
MNSMNDVTGHAIAFHSDLKPANILATANGILKITNFGQSQSLIRLVDESYSRYGFLRAGDLEDRAPEAKPSRKSMQAVRIPYPVQFDSNTKVLLNYDVWSLACIMTEALILIPEKSPMPPEASLMKSERHIMKKELRTQTYSAPSKLSSTESRL